MDLGNYGIGGNEVKIDASEGIAEIPQNRTLLVEQLTKDEPVAPEVITGLTNIDQVFAHFLPEIDIEFTDAEGAPVEENFRFHNVGDFSVKKIRLFQFPGRLVFMAFLQSFRNVAETGCMQLAFQFGNGY